jgi:crotonobetainyl-CoA:carnitine CoA-transferase CaiB-like acyl-CoA transferase
MSSLPLEGIRVLDLSRVLAGPLCTMMLGDLGATVIKVERPINGDDTRGWGPPFNEDGEAAYFLSVNRNKYSLAADLSKPDDQRLLLELIAGADVVVENFLPGVLARYGLDADPLLAENHRLIWATISGFGPTSRRPGYDFVAQAESGWMAITGEPDGDPMKAGVALVDVLAGKDASIGILAALAARGDGASLSPAQRRIHVALATSAVSALVNVAQNALVTGQDAKRWGNAHANLVPYQLFHAQDRPFVIAVGADSQWIAMARALDLDELAADDALRTNAGRLAQRERVVTAIAKQVTTRSAAYWMQRLDAVGVPCGVVNSVQDALATVTASARTGVQPLWNGTVSVRPPKLDEHGVTIREKQWNFDRNVPIPRRDNV